MSIYNNTRGRNFNTETGPIAVDFNDFASGHVYQRFEGAQTNRISNKYYAYFDVQSAGATTVAGDFTNDFVRQTTTFEHQRYFGFNRQKSFSDFLVQDEVVGSDANQTLIGADVFSVFDYNNVNPERWHSSERYAQTHKYGWNGSTHSFGDKLFGMGGDDTLKGMAGNDMLSGGTGNEFSKAGPAPTLSSAAKATTSWTAARKTTNSMAAPATTSCRAAQASTSSTAAQAMTCCSRGRSTTRSAMTS